MCGGVFKASLNAEGKMDRTLLLPCKEKAKHLFLQLGGRVAMWFDLWVKIKLWWPKSQKSTDQIPNFSPKIKTNLCRVIRHRNPLFWPLFFLPAFTAAISHIFCSVNQRKDLSAFALSVILVSSIHIHNNKLLTISKFLQVDKKNTSLAES